MPLPFLWPGPPLPLFYQWDPFKTPFPMRRPPCPLMKTPCVAGLWPPDDPETRVTKILPKDPSGVKGKSLKFWMDSLPPPPWTIRSFGVTPTNKTRSPTFSLELGIVGRRLLKFWSYSTFGDQWTLCPPHDMCIKSNQEDKSPPSRPSDNGSAPACFQSLLEVQFSYYAHYQMTTTSSLSTISPSPSISFVFQDAHKQMRIIRFLHNL